MAGISLASTAAGSAPSNGLTGWSTGSGQYTGVQTSGMPLDNGSHSIITIGHFTDGVSPFNFIELEGEYTEWPSDISFSDDAVDFDSSTVFTSITYSAFYDTTTFSTTEQGAYTVGQAYNGALNYMATIPIRADGTAANIAAATSGASAGTSLSWANLIADDANVSAGDIIELYSAGGSFTASTGVVLQVTADMSGALGNPVIIREATGNTVSVIPTGDAIGIDFAAACNYVEVDLDVTQQSTNAAVHASGTAGISGDGYTVVYKGTVTGRAGAADDGDGISTDGVGTANRSELLLDGATVQDIRRITAAASSPQSVTCHDDARCKAINNTRIIRSNTVYATGSAATANFEMTGGEITTWYGDGINLNTNAGGNAIFNGVTITNDQDARLHVVTQNDQDGIILYNQCTISITDSEQISQNNSGVTLRQCTTTITDSSGFQFRCNRGKPIEVLGGSLTVVGAKTTQLFRIQGAGGRFVIDGVTIDVSGLTSGGLFTTSGSNFGVDNKFINNKLIGNDSGTSLTNGFVDADVRYNTFKNIGIASNSNRAVSVGETNGTSQVSDNIFFNCLGNNGCIFVDSGTPFIDRNNYSGGTADEGDELGSTTEPVLNSSNEPTTATVYQGSRAGGGSAEVDHYLNGLPRSADGAIVTVTGS